MKTFIIILFFIFINFLLLNIKLDIRKIEIFNKKIKINIYLQFFLLNKIKIFEKKITKKDIVKLIKMTEIKKIRKREKSIIENLYIQIEKCNIQILYNFKNPIYSAYIYGLLQAVLNIIITYANAKTRDITIKTYYKGTLYLYFNIKINISVIKTIEKIIKNKIKNKKKAII